MEVNGRGDCYAIDIVGGMNFLSLTPRGNLYINVHRLFYAVRPRVPLVNQSAEVVVALIYVTILRCTVPLAVS